MTDEFDTMRAALRATPQPDPDAKAAALRLAMENFDRAQGSTDPARLSKDRPARAGFLKGVLTMFKSLTSPGALATTTSVAALLIGLAVVLPQMNHTDPTPGLGTIEPASRLKTDDSSAAAVPTLPEPETRAETRAETLNAPALSDATGAGQTAPAPTPPPNAKRAAVSKGLVAAPDAAGQTVMAEQSVIADGPLSAGPLSAGPLPAESLSTESDLSQAMPDTESFAHAAANPVHITADDPVSTFSVDVDTAAYSVIRASLNAGQLPPPDAVRIEEMVNYFPYDYPAPTASGAPFTDTVTVMPTPWNANTRLVHIALQGRLPALENRPALNLVFLIDTSGSMDEPAKLPLLKQSLGLMLGKLRPQDQVAIVAYAGSAGTVLPPTSGADHAAILAALDNLSAGGGTAGAEGLALAYQVAKTMQGDGEVSRILLATDGDFNVGIADPEALKTYVATQRDGGTYLSVLGFGRGNLDDATMQALAQNGNGQAAYIDTLSEAQKVLVDQVSGALFPIADDVKIQVEWNPAQVAEYRLIGYETRALRREDFNNDRVDAGEIGAGLQVTALYEVTAPDSPALLNTPLRYQTDPAAVSATELGYLRLRYKEPGQDASNLIETAIQPDTATSPEARFAAAIAGWGQLLQHAPYLGTWGWDQAITLATDNRGPDPYGYRTEAVTLMRLSQSLSAQ